MKQKVTADQIEPQNTMVLIRQDDVDDKVGSILLADQTKEADEFACMTGKLTKMGELAFTYGTPGTEAFFTLRDAPKVHDRVMYRKYSGGWVIEGKDGGKYRLMDWTDIVGKVNDD